MMTSQLINYYQTFCVQVKQSKTNAKQKKNKK